MKLCIAEKPSVAREIAKILGANQKKDGYFEGKGYCVTWTFGHLCELEEPHFYNEAWKKWNFFQLPMLPEKFVTRLKNNSGVKKQFKIIQQLVKKAALVINCGDAGQEGELIQRWVLEKAKCKAPQQRLWISSLTEEAIKEGFKKLKPASNFDNLYQSAQCRAIGDWLLGMNASRAYTIKCAPAKQVFSIGRVQTPTLSMVVERDQAIQNFVPKPYWKLTTLYRNTSFEYKKEQLATKEEAQPILDAITNQPLEIKKVEIKKSNEFAPQLFDLTSLQVEANKKFGCSADQTLKTAQSLYEKKLISYPRVDTRYLPDDMFPKSQGILRGLSRYSNFTSKISNLKKNSRYFNSKKVTDHHAIAPTGKEGNLAGLEQQIYDLIARSFIASFYPPAQISKTKVSAVSNKHPFQANGKQILVPGWREVFPVSKKKDEKPDLPIFQVGEQGPHQPKLEEKFTQPPKYYTEATLLRAMETAGKQVDDEELREQLKANGIGRPSTRAAILETLFKRGYLRRERKNIRATEVGNSLISNIRTPALKSAELTGQWELKLRQVEAGKYNAQIFLTELKDYITGIIQALEKVQAVPKNFSVSKWKTNNKFSNSIKTDYSNKPATKKYSNSNKVTSKKAVTKKQSTPVSGTYGICPKCGEGNIIKGNKGYGCNRWREGCNFVIWMEVSGKKLTENQIKDLVTKRKTRPLSGFKSKTKEGVTFRARLILNENSELRFEF